MGHRARDMGSPSRGRILVADDEANARNAIAEILRDENYEVETAADGQKALQKFEEFDPHLIVTDLYMPLMSGLELMRQVQTKSQRKIGIVMMTANASRFAKADAAREGALDLLTKPLDIEVLLSSLEQAMRRQSDAGARS
jgi:CheY-like chemotaxis protein